MLANTTRLLTLWCDESRMFCMMTIFKILLKLPNTLWTFSVADSVVSCGRTLDWEAVDRGFTSQLSRAFFLNLTFVPRINIKVGWQVLPVAFTPPSCNFNQSLIIFICLLQRSVGSTECFTIYSIQVTPRQKLHSVFES